MLLEKLEQQANFTNPLWGQGFVLQASVKLRLPCHNDKKWKGYWNAS